MASASSGPKRPAGAERPPAASPTSKEQLAPTENLTFQFSFYVPFLLSLSLLLENEWIVDVTHTPPPSIKQIHRNLLHVSLFILKCQDLYSFRLHAKLYEWHSTLTYLGYIGGAGETETERKPLNSNIVLSECKSAVTSVESHKCCPLQWFCCRLLLGLGWPRRNAGCVLILTE
jgi:hypothetical protein